MILLKILAWLIMGYGLIGLLLVAFKAESDNGKPIKFPFRHVAFFIGLALVVILSVIVRIDAQEVGVVVTPKGVRQEPLHTGWHIVMPWCSVHRMDKTVWVYTCAQTVKEGAKPNADAIWTPTKEGIKIGFDISASWRINPEMAPWIYQNVSENDGGNTGRYLWLEENVIRPKLKSAMATVVCRYTPTEAYSTKREEIQSKVLAIMRDEVKIYKLIIDNIDIREAHYLPAYETAINNQNLAEKEVLRLVNVTAQKQEQLKQAEIDKNIGIQKAEGEARALQIKGTAINQNPKIIQLEWIQKWDGQLPTYMVGDKSNMMMMLPTK